MSRPRKRHQTVILVFGAVIVVAMIVGMALRPLLRRLKSQDLEGATVQTGIATVEALYGANPNDVESRTKPWAMVRFEGKLVPAASAQGIDRLNPGQPAQVHYR